MTSRSSRSPPGNKSETLAYVFFHRPKRSVGAREYVRALVRFHRGLAVAHPDGFQESAAFSCSRAPWKETRPGPIYLDWYVVDGFPALDPLREVAYRPPWVGMHRAIARRADVGWGAVYSARSEARAPKRTERLRWFSSTEATVAWLDSRAREPVSEGTLWRRQLALGPSPEFCWASEVPTPSSLRRAMVESKMVTLFG
ncbi:MAG: hypothetical protein L3K10_06815 [Thermoplasmata archaeon]|nr:hypothetical protein [Thermoplasmata archaeon]